MKLKFFQQSEAAECGLAALAMIAHYYGHDVNLIGLRKKYHLSMQGATLKSLIEIGSDLGFNCRPIKIELEDLDALDLPAILHWNLDHFVVVKKITASYIDILDPAKGPRRVRMSEVSRKFTGVALEMTPAADFSKVRAKGKIRLVDLWSRMAGFFQTAFQLIIVSLVLQILALIAPLFMQLVIDEALVRYDVSFLAILAMAFGAIFLLQNFVSAVRTWIIQVLSLNVTLQIKGNVVRHLLRLPLSFFEKRHSGDIISRLFSVDSIERTLTKGLVGIFVDSAMLVFTLFVIIWYSWKLALIVISFSVATLIISLALFPFIRRRKEDVIVADAELQTYLIETIRGLRSIKLFGNEQGRNSGWQNNYTRLVNNTLAQDKLTITEKFLTNSANSLQIVITTYIGALLIMGGSLTIGALVAFLAYQAAIISTVDQLRTVFMEFRLIRLHLDRLSDIIMEKTEDLSITSGAMYSEPKQITVKDLSYRYSKADPLVLNNINLTVEPGEFIAIMGPSGGGKTTLFKLLVGVLEPTSGQRLLNGQSLENYGLKTFRSETGVVSQNDTLLSGTIQDNISFFSENPDLEAVRKAAYLASIDDEIEVMPMKYLSLIGDMGTALSGGQQQRVLIARAFYKNANYLFLDEGTANLDEASEHAIAISLKKSKATKIVITHNKVFLGYADRVFTMIAGRLEEIPRDSVLSARKIATTKKTNSQ